MTSAASPARGSDLLVRSVAGAVMIAVALAAVVVDGSYFWGLVAIAALLMIAEWAGLTGMRGYRGALAIVATAGVMLSAWPGVDMLDAQVWGALLAATFAVTLLARSPWLGAGVLYAGAPALALLFLRDQSDGTELTLWTLAVVWTTDIGAYFAGRAIGGAKLAPRLSPNKTWAGLFGGMAAALIVGMALAWALHLPLRMGALGALLGAFAQGGDLFESWLKRRAGVKDSGRVLPGHGGALDRLDGLVPVACIVALLVRAGWI